MKRVIVVGGYGGFGARISELLSERGFAVVVAGRSEERAAAFCRAREGELTPAAIDRSEVDADALQSFGAWALVDAAGPFQGNDYRLPRACIAAGLHYCDIADAREFVAGIGALDAEARKAGLAVVSGASTCPALTAAVCDRLAAGLDRVATIDIVLSASNRAAASPAITRAVLSYAGKPMPLWRSGMWETATGGSEWRRVTFDSDGRPYRRLAGLCDIPDHVLLPGRYPGAPAIGFRAGTEIGLQNRAVQWTAWLVRRGIIADGRRLTVPAHLVQRLMRGIGGERSAMRVELTGWLGGSAVRRKWELLARNGDGPWVPCLAVPALLARLRDGEIGPGARPAAGLIDLADYELGFAPLAIRTTQTEMPYVPLYRRVMGEDFDRLPAAIRAMHEVAGELNATGEARIERGRNPIGRLIAWLSSFPAAGTRISLHVRMSEDDGVETWTRTFDGHRMRSELSARGDRLVERFGPYRFGFVLRAAPDALEMDLDRWWCGPLPLPRALAPKSPAREYVEGRRFHFDVPIALPLIGTVVRYRGWLDPVTNEEADAAPPGLA